MRNRINKIINFLGAIALTASVIVPIIDQNAQAGNIAGLTAENGVTTTNNVGILPWYIEKTKAFDAWKATNGGINIIVAVLDTGIDANHEDLTGKVIDSINLSQSATDNDVNGHGTAVAGIIAGSLENGTGTVGVAYNVKLLNVKVADDAGIVNPDAVAKGVVWAVDKGARVINLSFTLGKPDQTVENAINYAWNEGAVIIAAAGNMATSKETYPAACPNVIAVGATEKDDRLSKWTNKGNWVSVYAPGVELYTAAPNNKYTTRNGTSFSAPQVSGEAALLFAIARDTNDSGSTNDEVRKAILNNTDSNRINILKAVESLE